MTKQINITKIEKELSGFRESEERTQCPKCKSIRFHYALPNGQKTGLIDFKSYCSKCGSIFRHDFNEEYEI